MMHILQKINVLNKNNFSVLLKVVHGPILTLFQLYLK